MINSTYLPWSSIAASTSSVFVRKIFVCTGWEYFRRFGVIHKGGSVYSDRYRRFDVTIGLEQLQVASEHPSDAI